MKPTIQEVLSLPKSQQIAIIQAILAQWQAEASGPAEDALLERQLDLAESVAAALDAGQMGTIPLAAFREQIQQRRR